MNGLSGFYQQANFQFFSILFMKRAYEDLRGFSHNHLTVSPLFLWLIMTLWLIEVATNVKEKTCFFPTFLLFVY